MPLYHRNDHLFAYRSICCTTRKICTTEFPRMHAFPSVLCSCALDDVVFVLDEKDLSHLELELSEHRTQYRLKVN